MFCSRVKISTSLKKCRNHPYLRTLFTPGVKKQSSKSISVNPGVSNPSLDKYDLTAFRISVLITRDYSTSFSLASALFDRQTRMAISAIYGFVRFADEIVDTFHAYDKSRLLDRFEADYYQAVSDGISLNPVLHAFYHTVNQYGIPDEHIRAFLKSMRDDLVKKAYGNREEISGYIYGSADVVGLMCLRVFCRGDETLYRELEGPAMKLGSAFQKVNFLRDLKNDMEILERRYFPGVGMDSFDEEKKALVIAEIEADFEEARHGIARLPRDSRTAVLLAYRYYRKLLEKIRKTPAEKILQARIRVPDLTKTGLLVKTVVAVKLGLA